MSTQGKNCHAAVQDSHVNPVVGVMQSCQQQVIRGFEYLQANLQSPDTLHLASTPWSAQQQAEVCLQHQFFQQPVPHILTKAAAHASRIRFPFLSATSVGPSAAPGFGAFASISLSSPKQPASAASDQCQTLMLDQNVQMQAQKEQRARASMSSRAGRTWASTSLSTGPPPPAYLGSYQDATATSRWDCHSQVTLGFISHCSEMRRYN